MVGYLPRASQVEKRLGKRQLSPATRPNHRHLPHQDSSVAHRGICRQLRFRMWMRPMLPKKHDPFLAPLLSPCPAPIDYGTTWLDFAPNFVPGKAFLSVERQHRSEESKQSSTCRDLSLHLRCSHTFVNQKKRNTKNSCKSFFPKKLVALSPRLPHKFTFLIHFFVLICRPTPLTHSPYYFHYILASLPPSRPPSRLPFPSPRQKSQSKSPNQTP